MSNSMEEKYIQTKSTRARRAWSLISSRRRAKPDKKERDHSFATYLPIMVWMSHVIPFLARREQDALAQADREVWLSRRQMPRLSPNWPCGCITKFSRPVKSIAFADSQLWVAYCKSHIKQYDKLTGPSPNYKQIRHLKGAIAAVRCSPVDAFTVATAGERDGAIRLWKLAENSWTCCRVLQVYQHRLRHMIWSQNGDYIATWGQDGLLQVTSVSDGSLRRIHWKDRLEVAGCRETVAFTPNNKSVLFALNNDTVHQWNFQITPQSHRILPELHDQHGSYRGAYVTSLAFSPDGKNLAVGCHVSLIKMWSVVESTEGCDFLFNRQIYVGGRWSAVALLSFRPDGRYVACTNDGSQIRMVDLETDQVGSTWKGHTGRIDSLCYTPNGHTLASGACDRTVRLWDAELPD